MLNFIAIVYKGLKQTQPSWPIIMLSKFWNIISLVMLDNFVFTSRMENSVDADQLVSEKPADLELLSLFQNRILSRFRTIRPEFFH